jgi:hypothetical protein
MIVQCSFIVYPLRHELDLRMRQTHCESPSLRFPWALGYCCTKFAWYASLQVESILPVSLPNEAFRELM